MNNGLPTSIGRPCPDNTSGSIPPSHPGVDSGLYPLLHHHLPLGRAQALTAATQQLRYPNIWFGNFSPPPRRPQDDRDFSPSHPLVFPGHNSQLSHVYEAKQVPQTRFRQPQLQRAEELQAPPQRLHSLPNHIPGPPIPSDGVHARRPHVLSPLPNSSPLPSQTELGKALRQPRGPPRGPPIGPLLLPPALPLLHHQKHPPLRPRRPRSRKLQPARRRPVMAEDKRAFTRRPPPKCNDPGILGPRPLTSDSTRCTSPRPGATVPPSPDWSRPLLLLPPTPNRPRVLPNSRCRSPPGSHFPGSTSPPPPRSSNSVQRPLHLHSSSSHPPHLRPRRLCSDALVQAGTRLGDTNRLGQSPDLRPPQRSPPPERSVPRPSKPARRPEALPEATLATTRRHRRSYPLLPNPPSALPPTVFASSRGKIHLSLPQRSVPKERVTPLLPPLPSLPPSQNLLPGDTTSQAQLPTRVSPTLPSSASSQLTPTSGPTFGHDPPLLPQTETPSAPRRTFLDPEKLRAALASIPSAPGDLGTLDTRSQNDVPSSPPSSTRHLPSAHAPWILRTPMGEDTLETLSIDSFSSFHSYDLYSPSGIIPSHHRPPFLEHERSPSPPLHSPLSSPCSYDYGSAPDTD
uniref:Movement protein n=1 Tax=Watercress white vein virus TaxID=1111988 RepID=M4GPM0_9VIRU|nr:movement protein [Watercress white vein virus]